MGQVRGLSFLMLLLSSSRFLLLCCWAVIYFPSKTFCCLVFRLEFSLLLATSQSWPVSLSLFFFFRRRKKSEPKPQKWNGVTFIRHSIREGGKPLHGNSAPIVRPLARLPCCFQEALCAASAKAIFSYGVTKRQRAARRL